MSRTYIPEEKREYEKIYEATTGKVSHKILIELDDSEYEFLKAQAEGEKISLSAMARRWIKWCIDTMRFVQ